jgi:tetratricopeptide (TPR) repeat protein
MPHPLESAIVRIFSGDGDVVGSGCLVLPDHVATCAHVVAVALDLAPVSAGKPERSLLLDFPLLTGDQPLRAVVTTWVPETDVAGLRVLDPLPEGARPCLPQHGEEHWDHQFRAFGFPENNGVWIRGTLLAAEATGRLQLEVDRLTGYAVVPGFSGGPVWDDTLEGVVGIIATAELRQHIRTAFAISSQHLFAAWPGLAEARLDANLTREKARQDRIDGQRRAQRARQRVVNLRPLDVSHTFRDRRQEVQACLTYLSDESVRFIGIVGRSGMGKTALASKILADLELGILSVPTENRTLRVDGILYLNARSTGLGLERIYVDVGRMLGEEIAQRLARHWADKEISLPAKVELLLESLQEGVYLILLDNLEDKLTAEGEIADEGLRLFIKRCLVQPGGACIIVTSRCQPNLPRSGLGNVRQIPLRDGLPEDEAIALLHDLDPQGQLGLREASKAALREAIQRTQGIPRALEILVGMLYEDPTLSLAELLADDSLFGEQVVETLVAAGFEHLDEDERSIIEALAVYDRPVSDTAVAFLLHPWYPGLNVRHILRRLVKRYFVTYSRTANAYNLHPLDRDYAYTHLSDPESPSSGRNYTHRELERRAALYYATLRKPKSTWQTVAALSPQLMEFEHLVRAGEHAQAAKLLRAIDFNYLFLWGNFTLIINLREQLGTALAPASQAYNLLSLGRCYYNLDRIDEAVDAYLEGLEIARRIENVYLVSACLGNLGNAYRALGRFETTIAIYADAISWARKIGYVKGEATWLGNLGNAYRAMGYYQEAIEILENVIEQSRTFSDRRRLCFALGDLGHTHFNLGKFDRAMQYLEEGRRLAQQIQFRLGQSFCLLMLSRASLHNRNLAEAERWLREGIRLGVTTYVNELHLVSGILELLKEHYRGAHQRFIETESECREQLELTEEDYHTKYTLATALVGNVVSRSVMQQEHALDSASLQSALAVYESAMTITSAPGVVEDILCDLKLISVTGIEGLDPIFALLEPTVYAPEVIEYLDGVLSKLPAMED